MALSRPNFLHRIGRRLLWGHPERFRPIGILRGRGDVTATDYDLWIDGFPRSANTFAAKSFQLANPSVKIRSHRHLPPFVIQSLRDGKPGMLMMRRPEDAVLSWAIFWQVRVDICLDYYLDFHRALLPHVPDLFLARFEEVTTRFDEVIQRFNRHFGTNYTPMMHDAETLARCHAEMDRELIEWRGFVDEMRIPRPSPQRAAVKRDVAQRLRESPALARKLETANELYRAFAPAISRPQPDPLRVATVRLPTFS